MLGVSAIGSASASAGYFAKDNYYSEGEVTETAMWFGHGAEMLGLAASPSSSPAANEPKANSAAIDNEAAASGPAEAPAASDGGDRGSSGRGQPPSAHREAAPQKPDRLPLGAVDPAAFEAILNGRLPDGTQVGDPDRRRIGLDLTFSAPKSLSILALVGGDKRLLEANLAAVKAAMRYAEHHFAQTRARDDGRIKIVPTGNLVYALFAHDTSRAQDPQAHVHAVIGNLTRMPDGQWRSLHNDPLWRNNTVLGSVYHAALRNAVEKLGYSVELVGKHGAFEIRGVPAEVRLAFSQRREVILDRAAELGIRSPEGMNIVTKATRQPKIEPDRATLLEEWRDRAAGLGFDAGAAIKASQRALQAGPSLVALAESLITDLGDGLSALASQFIPSDDRYLDRHGVSRGHSVEHRTQVALASAIRVLEQREAAFEPHQLTKTALDLGLSGVTPEGLAERTRVLRDRGELVAGHRAAGSVPLLTTALALETERAILGSIEVGKGQTEGIVPLDFAPDVLKAIVGENGLNAGQLAAASIILGSRDRVVAVQGLAGAGKSTMLGAVARALEGYGTKAIGLAFQNKMVGDLADGTGLPSQTLASFLMPYEAMVAAGDSAGLVAARREWRGSYVIVDEASMISNRQMASLVELANRYDVERLVLVGDRQQLLSIDAGKSFALVQAGGTPTARMDQNLRQRTETMKIVAELTNRGRSGDAIALLGDAVISTRDRVASASARWLTLQPDKRSATLVLASGRETRGALNQAIQAGLRAEGSLTGPGLTLTVRETVDRTREEFRYAESYVPGLGLALWGNERALGLKRGDYRIVGTTVRGKVRLERGSRKLTIDPASLSATRHDDRMSMFTTKEIRLYAGDTIRWTANDKPRGLLNSALARVVAIEGASILVERADKSLVRLDPGDPMLRQLDLAYAINMHMAQGITTDRAMIVMGSEERMLSNQRLFNVAVTRARDGIIVVTDDKDKLVRQLERTTGDKTSALESVGELSTSRDHEGTKSSSTSIPSHKGLEAEAAGPVPLSATEKFKDLEM